MRVGLLGPLAVTVDGAAVEVRAARERSLLARLACDPGAVVSDDRLLDHLWGDDPPASARATLQTYVSHLRRTLAPATIERVGSGYRLTGVEVDVERFGADLAAGLAADDPAEARARLDAALAWWRGPALEDLGDDADATARRAALEEQRLHAIEELADVRLALGEHADVVAELERHVAAHPLRERPAATLMLALYRCGRQADALAVHRTLRTTLVEELGLEPGPDVRALEQRILDHDPSLAPSPPTPTSHATPTAVRPSAPDPTSGDPAERWGDPAVPVPLPGRLSAGRTDAALVGRRPELEHLLAAADASAAGGAPPLVVLRGEAGIGKTRLARELALVVAGRGETALWGRCPPDRGGTLEPWAEALDHLVRHRPAVARGREAVLSPVLPSLVTDRDPLLVLRSANDPRFALLEAATEVLVRAAADAPVTVVLDDLQWADPASLALLEHVMTRALPRLLVVATLRRPDPTATATADEVLVRLDREHRLDVVEVEGLSTTELRVLLDRATGGAADDDDVVALHGHTRGNPFFVNEVVAALGRDLATALADETIPLTAGVQAVLGQRLDHVGADDEAVLAAGAVLGDEFDLTTCAACAGRAEADVLAALERVTAAGLLEEGGEVGTFAFPHALVRAAVTHRTSAARRAVLAERATALRAERAEAEPEAFGRRIAGRLLGAQAVRDEAETASAATDERLAQSRTLLTRIAAGTSGVAAQPATDPVAAFPLNQARAGHSVLRLARTMIGRGERDQPRRRALECAALARRLGDPVLLAEAALTVGAAEGVQPAPGDHGSDELRHLLAEALRGLGDDDATVALRARLLAVLSCAQPPSGDGSRRDLLSAAALVAAERSDDPEALATALLARRRARRDPDGLAERRSLAERALAPAEASGSPVLRALSLGAYATDLLNSAELAPLDAVAAQGLALTDALPDAQGVAELFAAGLLVHRGALGEAMVRIDRATTHQLPGYGADLGADDSLTTLLLVLSVEQGTLAQSRASIDAAADRWPHALLWQATRAAAADAAGDAAAARATLDALAATGLDGFHRDGTHLAGVALAAEAAVRLGHPLVPAARALLEAHTDALVLVGALAVLDPRLRYLGLALAAEGRWAEAWEALVAAGELAVATGGVPAQRRIAADLDVVAGRLDGPPVARPPLAGGTPVAASPLVAVADRLDRAARRR